MNPSIYNNIYSIYPFLALHEPHLAPSQTSTSLKTLLRLKQFQVYWWLSPSLHKFGGRFRSARAMSIIGGPSNFPLSCSALQHFMEKGASTTISIAFALQHLLHAY